MTSAATAIPDRSILFGLYDRFFIDNRETLPIDILNDLQDKQSADDSFIPLAIKQSKNDYPDFYRYLIVYSQSPNVFIRVVDYVPEKGFYLGISRKSGPFIQFEDVCKSFGCVVRTKAIAAKAKITASTEEAPPSAPV